MIHLGIFGFSIIFGAFLGIFYDIFRIIRIFFKCKFWNVFIQDIIYFFLSGVSTFLFILFINSGEIRFYILAGELMGFTLYYLTLGSLVYGIFYRFSRVIKKFFTKIFRALFVPIKSSVGKIRLICLKKKINNQKIWSLRIKLNNHLHLTI